ncbi:MAG: hypothetical protein K2Q22_15340 [Cytophagales bacterium]|nr:hypothetical protein [Cytophagales bacterium]
MALVTSTPNPWVHRAILFLGFVALVGMVLSYTDRFFWDEPYYFHNLDLVKHYGWTKDFLVNEWGSAGPLYTAVHYYLLPLTGAQLPYIRLVNIGLLLMVMALSAFYMHRHMNTPAWGGFLYLAIPMTYVCAGVALTEIPSFVFLVLSLIFLFEALGTVSGWAKIGLSVVGGLLMGVAVMGRQPLLVSLVALPFLFLDKRFRSTANGWSVLAFILFSIPLPLYIFSVWHGLLAPKEQITSSGLAPWHVILGLGYISLITLIIAPNYFVRLDKKAKHLFLGVSLLFLISNSVFQWLQFTPMYSLLIRYLPPFLCLQISSLFSVLVVSLGAYYLYSCYHRVVLAPTQGIIVYMTLSILLLAITSIKITHQYSSRYAFQAAPFLVFQLSTFYTPNHWTTLRFGLAIAIGLGSLYSYIAY